MNINQETKIGNTSVSLKDIIDEIDEIDEKLKQYILFSGDTSGTVTLSQSAANFTYIEIFFHGADNYNSVKVYNPNGKRVYLVCGWFNGNTSGNVKISNVLIQGTSITKVNTTALCYDTSHTFAASENGIEITRVVGYK